LEAGKWAQVFRQSGYECFWFAGELDRRPEASLLVPEAHFRDSNNCWLNDRIFGKTRRDPAVTEMIHALRAMLKVQLHEFINRFGIELLVVENALTIPMHVPLGLAIAEIIAETQIPTIAHHHDFYWERVRFAVNAARDYLQMAFPPNLPNIEHVVINSAAQEELAHRTGISAIVIPNVLDFDHPPEVDPESAAQFLQMAGLDSDDTLILQPTRIVQRKGIEHAIELVKELKDSRYKLVISHEAGDEGFDYVNWLTAYAEEHQVDLRVVATKVSDPWGNHDNQHNGSERHMTLLDVYPHADFITYPSLYEGFGNAFLESIYFRKPMLINRYATFVRDIEPMGFDLIVMDGFLTRSVVAQVREVLESESRRRQMVEHNYQVAARHFSYQVLRKRLHFVLMNFFGMEM
jgi:glycosyltransferase involved in cell wall biosynthesis